MGRQGARQEIGGTAERVTAGMKRIRRTLGAVNERSPSPETVHRHASLTQRRHQRTDDEQTRRPTCTTINDTIQRVHCDKRSRRRPYQRCDNEWNEGELRLCPLAAPEQGSKR